MIGNHQDHFSIYQSDRKFYFDPNSPTSRSEAYAKAEAHVAARKQAVAKKLGREPTLDELLDGVQHPEDRSPDQVNRDKQFQPVRKPAGRYDKLKSEILQKMENKRVAAMDTLERQLYDVERLEQQDAEQIAEQNAKDAHLANPRTKAALKELNGLLDDYRYDESVPASQVAAVRNALAQWKCHDADTDVAETMLRTALDQHDAMIAERDEAKREQIRQIEATLVGDRKPRKVEIDRTKPLREQAHDLVMAMYDGDFSFDECERVQSAIRGFDAGGDSGSLERMVDCFAVGQHQTIVE